MRARSLAAFCAMVMLVPATGVVVAAEPAPTPASSPAPAPVPPTVTPLCATDIEFAWRVSSDAAGLADYAIDYTTKRTQDWSPPNGGKTSLAVTSAGGHAITLYTARADGAALLVRWTSSPDQVASAPSAPTKACDKASLTVNRVVQGGPASGTWFPVSLTRWTVSFVSPSQASSMTIPVTSDAKMAIEPGHWMVEPTKDAGSYVKIPEGYVWRSTACATTGTLGVPDGQVVVTTDRAAQGLRVTVDPASTTVCTVTYHLGPVLEDAIAPGRKPVGTRGFGPTKVVVPSGSYVTYLVATSPSLAGRKVQILTKTGSLSKPWKLAKVVTVASDGSIRYYAKVTSFTGFVAKWPGDTTYVASRSSGRYADVK
jgi:hypothetical protein